ncbi:MAG: isoprenylcysteine carboxyl methyltransferase [Peptococcaceae bacterium BRH_c8a]|nr:MAG: isoprenylcysteine carboxyl methyltransferase [Peptococcaceae bacterium BRH_c8a]
MESITNGYGLWTVVLINSFIFIIFTFSFFKPKTSRDWRSFGGFSAFIIALFTEMYGFPLTIYFLSGWLGTSFPGLNLLTHDAGHLWYTLLGLEGDPHTAPIHLLSNVLIFVGMYMIISAWRVLHAAQQKGVMANNGLYAYIRHPQYTAFMLIMVAFLLQWPTLLTILMFPVLVWVYRRLAKQEEIETIDRFGDDYVKYAEVTPAFIPAWGRRKLLNIESH